ELGILPFGRTKVAFGVVADPNWLLGDADQIAVQAAIVVLVVHDAERVLTGPESRELEIDLLALDGDRKSPSGPVGLRKRVLPVVKPNEKPPLVALDAAHGQSDGPGVLPRLRARHRGQGAQAK